MRAVISIQAGVQDALPVQHDLRLAYVDAPTHQRSRKVLSIFDWLGCFSFRSALASI
jgi:hypothetical protein